MSILDLQQLKGNHDPILSNLSLSWTHDHCQKTYLMASEPSTVFTTGPLNDIAMCYGISSLWSCESCYVNFGSAAAAGGKS
jgi:hypothetical protein